jgi:dihydroorotase
MSNNWLVKGARVLDPSQDIDSVQNVLIENGRIAALGVEASTIDMPEIDAQGLVLTPGFVDLHCHLREPGFEYKETIATGTRAAVRGGFTTVCSMANTEPVVDSPATVEFILERAREAAAARVYPLAAVTQGFGGKELVEMATLAEAGVVAFSDDGLPVADARMMRHALEYSLLIDKPIVNHCEEPSLAHGGVMNEGSNSLRLGLPGMPAEAEETMVARDALLAKLTGAHVHIAHVSTQGSVEIIRAAKQRGIRITAEVTPHHLTLTDRVVGESQRTGIEASLAYDTHAKVNPPLRTGADVDALIEGLNDGTLDAIATDHAPHSTTDKLCEYGEAASGISCLETAFSQVFQLAQVGRVPLQTLVSKLTVEPSQTFGLPTGTLAPGAPADIAILDLDANWTVEPDEFASKGKNTPIAGYTLPGMVVMTFVDGKLVHSAEHQRERGAQ